MSDDEVVDPFRKLMEKAERLAKEELEIQDKFDEEQTKIEEKQRKKAQYFQNLITHDTMIQEEIGKLSIGRLQKIKEIDTVRKNIEKAESIREEHRDYFKAIETLTGDKLISRREEIIGDNWALYGSVSDEYRSLVGKDGIEGAQAKIEELKNEINQLSERIEDLHLQKTEVEGDIEIFLEENPSYKH